jgi:hypothetical protein
MPSSVSKSNSPQLISMPTIQNVTNLIQEEKKIDKKLPHIAPPPLTAANTPQFNTLLEQQLIHYATVTARPEASINNVKDNFLLIKGLFDNSTRSQKTLQLSVKLLNIYFNLWFIGGKSNNTLLKKCNIDLDALAVPRLVALPALQEGDILYIFLKAHEEIITLVIDNPVLASLLDVDMNPLTAKEQALSVFNPITHNTITHNTITHNPQTEGTKSVRDAAQQIVLGKGRKKKSPKKKKKSQKKSPKKKSQSGGGKKKQKHKCGCSTTMKRNRKRNSSKRK